MSAHGGPRSAGPEFTRVAVYDWNDSFSFLLFEKGYSCRFR